MNKDFRDGVVLTALTAIELFIKFFTIHDIEPPAAVDTLLQISELSDKDLEDIEAVIKMAYKNMNGEGSEFSAMDVFVGVLIKLVEKRDSEGLMDKIEKSVDEVDSGSSPSGQVN